MLSAVATIVFLLGVEAAQSFEYTVRTRMMPVIQHHDVSGVRFLALEEGNQCFDDSKALDEEIDALGIDFNPNIECIDDDFFCSADARDLPQYDEYVAACVDLNGQNYTYHLQCEFFIDIIDIGSEYGTFQWTYLVQCFAPTCNTTEVIDSFNEGFTIDLTTNGVSFQEISCSIQDLTVPNGTVVVENMEVYKSSANGGFFLSASVVLMTLFVALATFSRI